MKCIRCTLIALLSLLLLVVGVVEASAANTGFHTELLPEDDINSLLKNVNITMLTDEPPKKPIECFDVNENALIAIGCSSSENKTVCIYSNEGVFQYGYGFKCSGSFGIEFDKNTINIYLVRSDVAIAVNSEGEVEGVSKIQNAPDNNSYWNDRIFSTRRKIADTEYFIKNDMGVLNLFASSYSQLISTNQCGEETILYDVNSAQIINMTVSICGVVIFTSLVIAVVIRQFIKLKRKN